jgi:hypothetical protein
MIEIRVVHQHREESEERTSVLRIFILRMDSGNINTRPPDGLREGASL